MPPSRLGRAADRLVIRYQRPSRIRGDDVEKAISDAMDQQISDATAAKKPAPAFCYNLGDVVYFNGESKLYPAQFYEPYQNYHAAILAIAGNHDGDNSTRT